MPVVKYKNENKFKMCIRDRWEGGVVGEVESASKWTSAEAKLRGVNPCDVASLSSASGGHPFIGTTLYIFDKLSLLGSTSLLSTSDGRAAL